MGCQIYSYLVKILFIGILVGADLLTLDKVSYAQTNFDLFFEASPKYQDLVVEKVITINTFSLEDGKVIQLIGLKAPEIPKTKKAVERDEYGFVIKQPADPLISIEEQALNFVKGLLEGKHVRLEFDAEMASPQHFTLAYVFLLENNLFVNAEILRQGFAYLHIKPPNTKYNEQLREAYREARKEKRGLQDE